MWPQTGRGLPIQGVVIEKRRNVFSVSAAARPRSEKNLGGCSNCQKPTCLRRSDHPQKPDRRQDPARRSGCRTRFSAIPGPSPNRWKEGGGSGRTVDKVLEWSARHNATGFNCAAPKQAGGNRCGGMPAGRKTKNGSIDKFQTMDIDFRRAVSPVRPTTGGPRRFHADTLEELIEQICGQVRAGGNVGKGLPVGRRSRKPIRWHGREQGRRKESWWRPNGSIFNTFIVRTSEKRGDAARYKTKWKFHNEISSVFQ